MSDNHEPTVAVPNESDTIGLKVTPANGHTIVSICWPKHSADLIGALEFCRMDMAQNPYVRPGTDSPILCQETFCRRVKPECQTEALEFITRTLVDICGSRVRVRAYLAPTFPLKMYGKMSMMHARRWQGVRPTLDDLCPAMLADEWTSPFGVELGQSFCAFALSDALKENDEVLSVEIRAPHPGTGFPPASADVDLGSGAEIVLQLEAKGDELALHVTWPPHTGDRIAALAFVSAGEKSTFCDQVPFRAGPILCGVALCRRVPTEIVRDVLVFRRAELAKLIGSSRVRVSAFLAASTWGLSPEQLEVRWSSVSDPVDDVQKAVVNPLSRPPAGEPLAEVRLPVWFNSYSRGEAVIDVLDHPAAARENAVGQPKP